MSGFFNHFQTLQQLPYYSKLGRGTWQGFMGIRLSLWIYVPRKLHKTMKATWRKGNQEVRRWAQHTEEGHPSTPTPVLFKVGFQVCYIT